MQNLTHRLTNRKEVVARTRPPLIEPRLHVNMLLTPDWLLSSVKRTSLCLFCCHPMKQPSRTQPRPSRPGNTRWPWTGSSASSASRSSGRAINTKTTRTRRRAGGTPTSTGPGSPGRWSCTPTSNPSCWWQVGALFLSFTLSLSKLKLPHFSLHLMILEYSKFSL